MTTSEFAEFDLIIIGEPWHGDGPTSAELLAAYDTRNTWAAAVSGRIVVSGMDPAFHAGPGSTSAGTYLKAMLNWLTTGPARQTALYVAPDWGTRNLDFLSPFGTFGSTACEGNTITIASPSHPIMMGSTSASLSRWTHSAHSYLTYPASFSSLATATDGTTTGSVVVVRDPAFTIVHALNGITANVDHTISLGMAGVVPARFAPYYDIYLLDASTNLVDWSPLAMVQRTNASLARFTYHDQEATNFNKRFYRTPTNFLITPCPKPTGPYPVGTVTRLMTDPSRSDRYNIPGNRSFMATFWYPAEMKVGLLPEPYVEKNDTLYSYLNQRDPGVVDHFVSHAMPGLELATNQSSYPVIIYSHGGGFRRQNTDKAQDLASHGYIVVAVDHVWTTATVFPNGEVGYGWQICFVPKTCFQSTLESGIQDYRFLFDEMTWLNSADPLFAGRFNLERVGALGFSVGCVMAAEFGRIDPRCRAVVLLDVGSALEAPPDLNELGLQKPFLSMNSAGPPRPLPPSGYNPEWLYASLVLFTNAVNNAFWCQLQDSSHQSFQDRGSLISEPLRTADPTPTSRAQAESIKACTRSFFDKYLKDQDDHLLDNPTVVYPNIINFRSK